VINKTFLKSKPECRVTFKVSKAECRGAVSVALVGSFNNWDVKVNPMKALKSGDFSLTLNLPTGSEYAFRYVFDEKIWMTDNQSDKFTPNGFDGAENGVIVL